MLTLLRRTPALLPRGSIRLLASESAKVSQDLHSETMSPGPAPPQQNPLEARDYFGVFTVQSLASLCIILRLFRSSQSVQCKNAL